MSTDNLRVAVVGAGQMGADHVRRITAKISNADVVAIVEPDQGRAAAAAALAPGAIAAASFDEALDATAIDAVIIATPGFLHEPILVTALERGLMVLCEKPLTTLAEDSLRIVELEQQHASRPVIQVGFMRRFDAGYKELLALRESGANGALLALHHAHRNPTTPPNYGEDMLIKDSVIHEIDIIPFLTGEPIMSVEVKKPRSNSLAPAGLPEPQFVLFTTESGVLAIVEISVNVQFGYQVTTEAVFESGVAYIGRETSQTVVSAGLSAQPITPSYKERFSAAYDEEVQRWVDAARGGGIDGPSAWDGYTASVVAEVAVRAQQTGALEPVEYAVTKPTFYDEVFAVAAGDRA
ncbi:Gfo/Idh/MocA family protein [Curtobacterium ammoniigenes]|uniref:Gfo/Idh/MocA family protein n=1 Tax=Curtobacterium ammoniigenes TaxID=395387 RepID=UPI000A74424A|nr:Gfo/Idh/MocA family oxidoreductase [Curtobacterium ammoniigenes]